VVVAGSADTDGQLLKLSAEIYPLGAVRRAIAAFSPHATLSVETRGAYHEVAIVPVSGKTEKLAGEIANYVLAIVAQEGDAAPVRPT
jgi:hypothetical protein